MIVDVSIMTFAFGRMMTTADRRKQANAFVLLCDYQYGDSGSKARGIVHYNLHRGVGASPTVHLLVGGLIKRQMTG